MSGNPSPNPEVPGSNGHPTAEQLRWFRQLDPDVTREQVAAARADLLWVYDHMEVANCSACITELTAQDAASGDAIQDRLDALERAVAHFIAPPIEGYQYTDYQNTDPTPLPQQGSGGTVYRAQNDQGTRVIIKFLHCCPGLDSNQRMRLLDEIDVAKSLRHDAVVKVMDVRWGNDWIGYVMEEWRTDLYRYQSQPSGQPQPLYLPPGSAFHGDRFSFVAACLRSIADGVNYTHEDHHIIHRDLKPGNIMVGAPDPMTGILRLAVSDFGTAGRLDRERNRTGLNEVVGTPDYISPEQLLGSGPNASMDVFGLGAILFFMLTGKAPFPLAAYQDDKAQANAILTQPPFHMDLLRDVPADLVTICLHCLHKKPEDRYQSVSGLINDLSRFLNNQRPLAKRNTLRRRTEDWVRKNPSQAASMGLLAAAVLFLVVAVHSLIQAREADQAKLIAQKQTVASERQRQLAIARSLLDRGLLGEAEEIFDRLIADAPDEECLGLRIERLRTLFAFGRWEVLERELRDLFAVEGLTSQQCAEVLLHWGDAALSDPDKDRQKAGEDALCQALAIEDGLRPCDVAYARGVLAATTNEALAHLKAALDCEGGKFHLRANLMLLTEETLSGQFDQARRRADFLRAAFPREAGSHMALTLIATLERDAVTRKRHRDDLARLLNDAGRMAGIDEVLQAIDRIVVAFDSRAVAADKNWVGLLLAWQFGLRTPVRVQEIPRVVGLGLPVLARTYRNVEKLMRAHRLVGEKKVEEALRDLEQLEKESPESAIRQLHAIARAQLFFKRIHSGMDTHVRAEGERIYRIAKEAADAPTLIPCLPGRQNFRWLCVCLEQIARQEDRTNSIRCVAFTLGSLAGTPAGVFPSLTGVALQPTPSSVIPTQWTDGQLHRALTDTRPGDRSRAEELPKFVRHFIPDVARLVLLQWVLDEPKNVKPLTLLAETELELGNFDEALRRIDQAIELDTWFYQPYYQGLRKLALNRQRSPGERPIPQPGKMKP